MLYFHTLYLRDKLFCFPLPDDVLALMMAFAAPECEVLGITTCYGNVPTELATKNALILTERLGRTEVRAIKCASPLESGLSLVR